MQIFINASSFDENNGGVIVLHRLCHLINTLTKHSAYLVPIGYPLSGFKRLRRLLRGELIKPRHFKTKEGWNTPLWNKVNIPYDAIGIYPEIVNGNPMNVKYVVRWLLHQPGFHTGNFQYGKNELYFKFNSAIKDFTQDGSYLSKNELKVIYYPIDTYYPPQGNHHKFQYETCHLVRKGASKKFIHSNDSIALDGKSHQEIADIFRKSKQFICYDDYTAYSIFAVLCGCQSIVIPDEKTSLTEWYPNEKDRYGIAYGFSDEQLQWANNTKTYVLDHILAEHKKTEENVIICLNEIETFFKLH